MIWVSIWLFIGFVSLISFFIIAEERLTILDLLISLIFSLFGPIPLIVLCMSEVNWDIELWRKK